MMQAHAPCSEPGDDLVLDGGCGVRAHVPGLVLIPGLADVELKPDRAGVQGPVSCLPKSQCYGAYVS